VEIIEDDEGAWVASIPDLPGCNSFGNTPNEAIESVHETKRLWIEGQYELNAEIPEPLDEEEFSGKFVLRIPKVLHRTLTHEAKRQSVSLNHYASHLLSQRQSVNAFQVLAHSILNSVCINSRTPWLYSKREPDNAFVVGNLPGRVEFVGLLRKPPAECTKAPLLLSPAVKKQYQAK
jgi:predicted RNase H-like HicB family nuclease